MNSVTEIYKKVPPYSAEAERGVLGAVLLDNVVLDRAVELAQPGDFYEARNRLIYETMLALSERGEPIDLVTLTDELRRNDTLDKAGGVTYVSALTEATPTASHVETYARIVRAKAIVRTAIAAAGKISQRGYEDPADVDEYLDEAQAALFDLASRKVKKSYWSLKELIPNAITQIEARSKQGDLTGVATGYYDIDQLTGGLQPSDLIVIAGRPGMGKTSLALNVARNVVVETDEAVAFFSLEMSRLQLATRLFCSEAKVDSADVRRGYIHKEDWARLMIASNLLMDAKLYIDDSAALSTLELKAKARRLVVEHNVKMVVVDYMQLMRGNTRASDGREREISDISQALKALAKELDVPVIALSQLNRDCEKRENKRPRLSDLRESGAIEQDADLIIFLYREKRYDPDTPVGNVTEAIFGKHRNGPEGVTIKLAFIEEYARFENHDPTPVS